MSGIKLFNISTIDRLIFFNVQTFIIFLHQSATKFTTAKLTL